MIIPKIMPGELTDGYLVRLGKINHIHTKEKTISKLRAIASLEINRHVAQIPILLSDSLKISVEEFLKYHTLWPVLSSIVSYEPTNKLVNIYGAKLNHEFIKTKSMVKACRLCAEEDIDFHGFSYWRTEHQLPGYQRCSKHNHQLEEFKRVFKSPHEVLQNSSRPKSIDIFTSNHAISNYMTIVDSWALSMRPIYHLTLTNMMQRRAKELCLTWSIHSKKRKVSDLVFESFPLEWLRTLIPNADLKLDGNYFGLIDRLFSPQPKASRSCLYALVLSVLFDNPIHALNSVNEASKSVPKIAETKIDFDSGLKQKKYLKNIYIKNNGNYENISKELGLTSAHTREIYRQHGYCSFEGISTKLKSTLIDFSSGMGLVDACKKHNVNLDKIEELLRDNLADLTHSISKIYSNSNTRVT